MAAKSFIFSQMTYDLCRHSHRNNVIWQVSMHQGPGSNDTPGVDPTLGNHSGADAYQRSLSDVHIPAQVNAGGNVGVIPDAVVVIDSAAGVQDDVGPDDAARVDDHAGADHAAGTNCDIGCDDGPGMLCDHKALTLSL